MQGVKYVHTNIIAADWKKLSVFYQNVFGCVPVPPERNLKGEWLDRLTAIKNAHIQGEHLALPGYEENLPTLEIYSYDGMEECDRQINRAGLAHLAFEVEDVSAVLDKIEKEGGGRIGDVVTADYPGGIKAMFVYATDIEGNIIELQSWEGKA